MGKYLLSKVCFAVNLFCIMQNVRTKPEKCSLIPLNLQWMIGLTRTKAEKCSLKPLNLQWIIELTDLKLYWRLFIVSVPGTLCQSITQAVFLHV